MQTDLPKVLHPLAGATIINHVVETVRRLHSSKIHVVVGYKSEMVKASLSAFDIEFHLQKEQLGTGHAVKQALSCCNPSSKILILFGDVPLIRLETLQAVVRSAESNITMLAAHISDPTGYGRVIRDQDGEFIAIVEERDASTDDLEINEVNTGVLAGSASHLSSLLGRLNNNNAQSEYYLPGVLSMAREDGALLKIIESYDIFDVMGVNTQKQLQQLERLYQRELADQLMLSGVTICDRDRVDIRGRLVCGRNVHIDVNVVFEGEVLLGDNVKIGANCVLKNAVIGSGTKIEPFSYIEDSEAKQRVQMGPFARVRNGTVIGNDAKLGNFVEVKNSRIASGAKANHLAYLGDAAIGVNANIGAGTITCNYDGAAKHRTEIGEDVFIGSNSTLIAPIKIGSGGFVAAGSVVTDDVEPNQLAVARGKQHNVDGWQRPSKPKDGS